MINYFRGRFAEIDFPSSAFQKNMIKHERKGDKQCSNITKTTDLPAKSCQFFLQWRGSGFC